MKDSKNPVGDLRHIVVFAIFAAMFFAVGCAAVMVIVHTLRGY